MERKSDPKIESEVVQDEEEIDKQVEETILPIDRSIENDSPAKVSTQISSNTQEYQIRTQGVKLIKAAEVAETSCDIKKLDADLLKFAQASLKIIDEDMQSMLSEKGEIIDKIVSYLKEGDDCKFGELEKKSQNIPVKKILG